MTNTPPTAPIAEPLLVNARELAKLLSVSVATVWRMLSAGKLPRPLRPTPGICRWKVDEIRRWVDSGMPALETWEMGAVQRNGRRE
jgi:predicted DNA-binding transcriptional regulator AlpA